MVGLEGSTWPWGPKRGWARAFVLLECERSYGVQHLLSKEGCLQADLVAPQVQTVALYRLCRHEKGIALEMFGCGSEERSSM